jgi:hypothetical protein
MGLQSEIYRVFRRSFFFNFFRNLPSDPPLSYCEYVPSSAITNIPLCYNILSLYVLGFLLKVTECSPILRKCLCSWKTKEHYLRYFICITLWIWLNILQTVYKLTGFVSFLLKFEVLRIHQTIMYPGCHFQVTSSDGIGVTCVPRVLYSLKTHIHQFSFLEIIGCHSGFLPLLGLRSLSGGTLQFEKKEKCIIGRHCGLRIFN